MGGSSDSETLLPIGAVERETGVSKDTLRMWERRYGFPKPLRDGNGDRVYPLQQVERLRVIKRLVDNGFRPGKVIPPTHGKLLELSTHYGLASAASERGQAVDRFIRYVKRHQLSELKKQLNHELLSAGLRSFIADTIAPLNILVGEAWMRGEIAIFEEHLYSEVAQNILRGAATSMNHSPRPPKVLLTTLPGEQHNLGLLMVECVLAIDGADSVPLGVQLPVAEIMAAVASHQADVLALSFSAAYNSSKLPAALIELRERIPAQVRIWAGGTAISRMRKTVIGVDLMSNLTDIGDAVAGWRTSQVEVNEVRASS